MSENKEVGWWEWVQSTKDKVVSQSSEVLELVKKDIEEFSKVVSEETSSVVSSTASSIKEKLQLNQENSSASQVKKSVSGFLNHVVEVLTPTPDDEDQEAIMILNQQPVTLDRLQAAKYSFCSMPSNFVKEPENEKNYESWLQSFNIDAHENELPVLLAENDVLRQSYLTLVPTQLSHIVFWHKYFYEMELLEKAEEKRQEMKKRAEEGDDEDKIVWEDVEDLGEKVVISEQMQQKLLEDYEKEMQESDSSKPAEEVDSCNLIDESPRRTSKSSTPSSKDTEEEWEKVDDESQVPPHVINESDASPAKSEDWEKWE